MADPKIVLSAVDRTGAAFASAKRNLEGLMQSAAGITARFGSVGAAVAAAFTGVSIKGAIDAGDELNKLSQKTGIAVETLSGYKLATSLANVSTEDFAKGVKTLSVNLVAAGNGGKEQARAFQAIGVNVKAADGSLRNIDAVLGDVADRFSGYEDGAEKAALAQELFGRSGASLIPLLNAGKKGLEDTRKEAEALGAVFGKDLAEQSERFNDNLTRLGVAAQGAKIALANDLLPTLIAITEQLLEGRKAYGSFTSALLDIGLNVNPFKSLQDNIAQVGKDVDDAKKKIEEFGRVKDSINPFVAFNAGRQIASAEVTLNNAEPRKKFLQSEQAREALQLAGTIQETNPRLRPPTKKRAPAVGDGSSGVAPDQVALLKNELQRREKLIEASFNSEKDILSFNERFVQEVYRSGTISLESNYQAQAEIRRRNVEEVRRAADETIAAETQFQSGLAKTKPKDEADAQRRNIEQANSQARIGEARAKVAAAERDAQQQSEIAAVQKTDQTQKLLDEVNAFNAAITDLADGGRSRAGELTEIATKVKAAQDLLIQGGASEPDAQAQSARFGALLEQQRQFNLLRDELARITDRARDAEESLLLTQEKSGTGLIDGQRQVFELRKQELAQLDALIDKTREFARVAAERNGGVVPDNIAGDLRRIELQRQRLSQNLDPQRLRANQSADNIGDAIADGLSRAIVEGEKLSDVINAIGKDILSIITREVITEPLAKSISGLLKSNFSDGGGNILTQIFGQFGGGSPPLGEVAGIPVGGAITGAAGAATQVASQTAVVAAITSASTAEITALTTAITTSSATEVTSITATGATESAAIVSAIGISTTAIVTAIAAQAATNTLSGVGSLFGSGGAGFGGGDGFGFLFHEGGVAGQGGEKRAFSLDVFNDARRYHTGGIAGAPADFAPAVVAAPAGTVPAVLQVGEEAIAASDPRHRDNPIGRAIAAGEVIASGETFVPGRIVQAAPVPGLAPDEVPTFLPLGTEILTAADPRHIENIRETVDAASTPDGKFVVSLGSVFPSEAVPSAAQAMRLTPVSTTERDTVSTLLPAAVAPALSPAGVAAINTSTASAFTEMAIDSSVDRDQLIDRLVISTATDDRTSEIDRLVDRESVKRSEIERLVSTADDSSTSASEKTIDRLVDRAREASSIVERSDRRSVSATATSTASTIDREVDRLVESSATSSETERSMLERINSTRDSSEQIILRESLASLVATERLDKDTSRFVQSFHGEHSFYGSTDRLTDRQEKERTFSLSVFKDATRYHSGGKIGEPADAPAGTVPVVLQAGEEVIAPSDPRHRDQIGSAMSAAEAIASGDISTGGVVRAVPRVDGLAADEVPAFLPAGYEVLTADDPRHIDNLGIPQSAVAKDGALVLPDGPSIGGSSSQKSDPWWRVPKYHVGGVAGRSPSSFMERSQASTVDSKQAKGDGVVVNIINKTPNSKVTEQRRSDGQLDVLIDQVEAALGQRIDNGGGLLKPISRRTGANGGAALVM